MSRLDHCVSPRFSYYLLILLKRIGSTDKTISVRDLLSTLCKFCNGKCHLPIQKNAEHLAIIFTDTLNIIRHSVLSSHDPDIQKRRVFRNEKASATVIRFVSLLNNHDDGYEDLNEEFAATSMMAILHITRGSSPTVSAIRRSLCFIP